MSSYGSEWVAYLLYGAVPSGDIPSGWIQHRNHDSSGRLIIEGLKIEWENLRSENAVTFYMLQIQLLGLDVPWEG